MTVLNILLWLIPTVLALALVWILRGVLVRFTEAIVRLETSTAPASAPDNSERGQDDIAALRLQACERFTLMLERISIPNLLLRLPADQGLSPREYTATLLLNIRQEFEYNITQQIYVSDSLWSIITQTRDNVSLLITRAAEGADTSHQIVDRLRLMSSRQPEDPIALAQGAIRREAASVLVK